MTPWQTRARAAGLTQRQIAAILDLTPQAVSRALRDDDAGSYSRGPVHAAIVAWELMTAKQRHAWQVAVWEMRQ